MADTAYTIFTKIELSNTLVPVGHAKAVGARNALVKWLATQNGSLEDNGKVTYVVVPSSRMHTFKPRVQTSITFA